MNVTSFFRNTLLVALFPVAVATTAYAQTSPELLHFRSAVKGQTIDFNWSVSEQSAVQSFGLERAGADMQFKTVGTVPAQDAEASYRLIDQQPLPGVAFYRLRVVNQSGDVAYCKVVSHRTATATDVGR